MKNNTSITTELEDKLYAHMLDIRDFLTKRKLGRIEYLALMAAVMQGIKLYENKRYRTHLQ